MSTADQIHQAPPSGEPSRPGTSIEQFLQRDGRTRGIAHRGLSGLVPENTLAAFEAAVTAGAEMIELDVGLTRDGHAVCMHDLTLDRTTTGHGALIAHDLEQVRRLDAGSWRSVAFCRERVPTLDEALDLARGRVLVDIEIKVQPGSDAAGDTRTATEVVRAVEERGMAGQVLVSSFRQGLLEAVGRLAPDLATARLWDPRQEREWPPDAASGRHRALGLASRRVRAGLIESCDAAGLPLLAYTVNSIERMRRLIRLRTHALFSDRVDLLLEVLATGRAPGLAA